jgi:hypothetical protein
VVTTIPPDFLPGETVSTHDLVEIRSNRTLDWKPEFMTTSRTLYGKAAGVKFRRDVFALEFSFKPLRMINVNGELVWYLVYKVRNPGEVLKPVEGANGVFTTTMAPAGPLRFIPQFVLESQDRNPDGSRVAKAYLDRVIPAAVAAIQARELPGRELLNSAEMAERELLPGGGRADNSVWGVATWTGVDPRIDFFSVYVGGLTNAYVWEDPAGAYRPGDPPGTGRRFARKMLQLNFWRPGDTVLPDEREIRYGVPVGKAYLYDVGDGVAYRWVYR